MDEANADGGNSYEIWVAEGVYFPDEDADGDHVTDAVTETFRISYNNVRLYGGFAAAETAREQRDWEANVTVLSGDIDGNDTTDACGAVTTTTSISGTNAYHVLWLDGETNGPITGTTIIDGVIISAGQADGSQRDRDGGGLHCAGSGADADCSPVLANVTFIGNWARRGGGMYCQGAGGNSSPVLTGVAFNSNWAYWRGGAIYSNGFYGDSSPALTNVTFTANAAGWDGGAMYNAGSGNVSGESNSSPTLTNALFVDNSAGWDGGAIYNSGSSYGTSNPKLTNVTFSGNSAGEDGGAMVSYGGSYGTSNPTLANVTFAGNSAGQDGGAMVNNAGYCGVSSPTLTNVILWGDTANGDGDEMYNVDATLSVGYSSVEGGWDGTGIYTGGSTFVDLGGNIAADPQFVRPEAGNLRLRVTSPAIDAGDNGAVPAGVVSDLDGHPRFRDIATVADTGSGTPPIVDMGAYEVQNRMYLPVILRSYDPAPEPTPIPYPSITPCYGPGDGDKRGPSTPGSSEHTGT